MANVLLGVVIGFVPGWVLGWLGGRLTGMSEGAHRERRRSWDAAPQPVIASRAGGAMDLDADSMAEWSEPRSSRTGRAPGRVGEAVGAPVSRRDVVDLDSLTVAMEGGAASSVGGDR